MLYPSKIIILNNNTKLNILMFWFIFFVLILHIILMNNLNMDFFIWHAKLGRNVDDNIDGHYNSEDIKWTRPILH